jgi:PAS domain S-box-containing protein
MTSYYKCRLDTDGKWDKFPHTFCDLLGYSQNELQKLSLEKLIDKKDQKKAKGFFSNIRQDNTQESELEIETTFQTKSGESIPVHASFVVSRNTNGSPEHIQAYLNNLSKQQELQRKLKVKKQQFESLFNYNPLPVYYYDLEGNFLDCNEKLAEFTGLEREEIIGLNFDEFITGEDLECAKEHFQKALEGKSGQYEIEVIVRDGVNKDIRVTKFPMYIGDEITGVYGIFEDITDRKKREKALQESEQRFRSMFENNPHSVFYFNTEGTFLGANRKFEILSGYSEEELKEKTFAPFIHPDDIERTQKHFENTLQGEIQKYEITGITRTGEEKQVHITNFPYLGGNEIIGVFGICEDITSQKKAEQDLLKSEQLFKSLFTHNPYPVMQFDLEGNFVKVNEKTVEMAGYPKEELLKSGFSSFIADKDLEEVGKRFQKAAAGEVQYYTITGHTKNGVLEIETTLSPIHVNHEIVGLFSIAKDITERKKAQENLKESEKRWQQLVEHNPQPVYIVQNDNIVFINETGVKYFGAGSANEIIGKSVLDFNHEDSLEQAKNHLRKLDNNERIGPAEYKIVLLNGETRYVEAHSIPITYKGEKAVQTVIHDISDLKEKQHIIGKSLKEKETMLQEIHHRIKNNLSVISGLLELQKMHISDEDTINALKDSQLRIQSMAMIHEKLYQSESLHKIGFDAYLKELINSINSSHQSSNSKVSTKYNLDHVNLKLNQAIPCSLIINEVIINTHKHAFNKDLEGEINITLTYSDPEITLEISDNGKGLPDDFALSQQQSLGSTLIKEFSRQLKGDMLLTNRKNGRGTKFRLQFEIDPDM